MKMEHTFVGVIKLTFTALASLNRKGEGGAVTEIITEK
jgi:hypothetical protein